jgi:hypothetical protein
MAQQLPLLDGPEHEPEWRIDEQTKAIGRKGLARARAALAASTRSHDEDAPHLPHRRAA